jgi:Type I restriction enzyme R protein N terminus (HSDR_N)
MKGHTLIMGELVDFITGETLKDTHDERYRQKIGRLLVNRKGYLKADIEPRKQLTAQADEKKAILKIDFVVRLAGKVCMVVKYAPGSLVTRRRAALAASRLIAPYQVPVAVVTNGEDAEIMNAASAEVIAQGLDSIPAKSDLEKIAANKAIKTISKRQAELESRILYCYEVDDRCECDDEICKL